MPSNSAENVSTAAKGSLTAVELSILEVLIQDPHASNRRISELLGLSISQVGTRMRRLESAHSAHVLAVLDVAATGQNLAFAFITVRGRSIGDVAQDLSTFREAQVIMSVVLGEYDLIALLRFRDIAHLETLVHQRMPEVEGCGYILCQVILGTYRFTQEYMAFSQSGLPGNKDELLAELQHELIDGVVDDLDRNIIAELQADGRCTSQHIARQYDVNAGTVRNRIRNLETRGLMRFATVIDPRAVGLNFTAAVMIEVKSPNLREIISDLNKIESMHYLFSCAGSFEVIGFLVVSDMEAARDIIANQIRNMAGVSRVIFSPLLVNHKLDLRWTSHVAT